MTVIELNIDAPDRDGREILMAALSDLPFHGFTESEGALNAYIGTAELAGCRDAVASILRRHHASGYRFTPIPDEDWNLDWERRHTPIVVDGGIVIRSPLHAPVPDARVEVLIEPCMSFGTGHHPTTRMVCAWMGAHPPCGARVLDMGTGTGVLAILSIKLGARQAVGVEIDGGALCNARHNVRLNGVERCVRMVEGDSFPNPDAKYDWIVANLIRNTILNDLPHYAEHLAPGGQVVVSGFLEADRAVVDRRAAACGLAATGHLTSEGWVLAVYRRQHDEAV